MGYNEKPSRRSGISEAVLWVLLAVLVFTAGAYFFNEAQTPFFQATAHVSFQSRLNEADPRDRSMTKERLLKHRDAIQLPELLKTVASTPEIQSVVADEKLKLKSTWLDHLLKRRVEYSDDAESVAQRIRDHLRVTVEEGLSEIIVSVTDPNPQFATLVAQKTPQEYDVFLKSQSQELTADFVKIKSVLKQNTRRDPQSTVLSLQKSTGTTDQLKKIWEEQNALKVRMEELDKIMRIAQKSLPSWITDQKLAATNNQLIQKTLQLQKLSPKSTEAQKVSLEIEALKNDFDRKLRAMRDDLNAQIEDLNKKEGVLLAQVETIFDQPIVDAGDEDEAKVLQKILQLKSLDPSTHGEELSLVAAPVVSALSTDPDKLFNLAVALIGSLAIAFTALVVRAFFFGASCRLPE